jgi:hypothetical protein
MTALISTKLYFPPPRPELIVRSQLLKRLDEVVNHKLTLVCAPAGFGKTSLLSAWHASLAAGNTQSDKTRAGTGIKAGWVALDQADNDPVRFWLYFLTTLEQLEPGVAQEALQLLQAPQPPSPEVVLTSLINNLNLLQNQPVLAEQNQLICVLDDYHLIENELIQRAVVFLLDHLPPRLHLVLLTRADPPLPLARLRTRRELLELRIDQLRFTSAEATEFLQEVMGLPGALFWSGLVYLIVRFLPTPLPKAAKESKTRNRVALALGAGVLSHWLLDLVVHRPDLGLLGNEDKVGLSLYDYPAIAFSLETLVLLIGMGLYLGGTKGTGFWGK